LARADEPPTVRRPEVTPTLVGYFPKRTEVPCGWNASANVSECCSVSTCLVPAPDGWIDKWLHNELGFYDDPSTARSVAVDDPSLFSIFAYRLLPKKFEHGEALPLTVQNVSPEPLSPRFKSLGWDVVTKSLSHFFECSPLSCCNLAAEVPVNRFCLLDSLESAELFAEYASRTEPEPGPYFVFEVLREKPSA
jgi:hypothetical protein